MTAVALLITGQPPLRAQTGEAPTPSALRTFIIKDGTKLTARIVSLSADGKNVTLRSPDELNHSMETTALSLENQIFVRDWVEAQATLNSSAQPIDVTLTVEPVVTKFDRRSIRVSGRNINHDEMHESYRIKLNQPQGSPRVTLRVSYVVLYWEKIAVYQVGEEKRTDWSSAGGQGRTHYSAEKMRIPVNKVSTLQEKLTAPVKIDRLEGESEAERLGHDQVIGIRIRVEDPFGNVIAKFTDLPEEYERLGWTGLQTLLNEESILEDSGAVTGVLEPLAADR